MRLRLVMMVFAIQFWAMAAAGTPAISTHVAVQQAMDAKAIYKKALPSVMTLRTKTKDGGGALGTAFLAIHDGVAVTAWHVIKDATEVTARFSDGAEFEVSGVIDKDEKRDVALIRVKVADRPLLPIVSEDPAVGSKCFIIGAPRGLEFSISEGIVSQLRISPEGRKEVQHTCAQNPGNSGGPLLDEQGAVLGIIDWHLRDSQGLNFAVAGTYAKGLDSTLRTQTWDFVKPGSSSPGEVKENSVIDESLAKSVKTLLDGGAEFEFLLIDRCNRNNGYRDGVPSLFYTIQKEIKSRLDELGSVSSSDAEREVVRGHLANLLASLYAGMDALAAAVTSAGEHGGWLTLSSDVVSRANAEIQWPASDIDPIRTFFAKDEHKGLLPPSTLLTIGVNKDASGYKIGVSTFASNTLAFAVVGPKSFAERLGFKTGDVIRTFDGSAPVDVTDFKLKLKANLGKSIKVEILRNGKVSTITIRIPSEIPKEFLTD